MQRKKPWRSALLCGLFCLLLAFAVLNGGIGASDPMDADNENNTSDTSEDGPNPGPVSDFRDYTFGEPEATGHTFYIDPAWPQYQICFG
jgi:hypothetical protein